MKMKTMRREEMMTRNSRDRRKSHAVRLLYIPDLEGKVYLVQIYSTTSTIYNTFSSPVTVDVFQFHHTYIGSQIYQLLHCHPKGLNERRTLL